MSRYKEIPRPFMTQSVKHVRKGLPFEAVNQILATYFYVQQEIWNPRASLPDNLERPSPDIHITSEQYLQAPILVFLEMRKQDGRRQDVEHPGFVGPKYIGDLQTPSEIGISSLDLRRCFTSSDNKGAELRFHRKPPGIGGQNWAFDYNILHCHHLVCTEDLATDMEKYGSNASASKCDFACSDFIPRKDMMGRLAELLRVEIMRDVRDHNTLQSATPKTKDTGDSLLLPTNNALRSIFIITWDGNSVISQLDACQLDYFDHCNPDSPVRIIDMQRSLQWPECHTLDFFARKIGVYPESNLTIPLKNAGNSSFLSALGFLKHTFMTQTEYLTWTATMDNLPRLAMPDNVRRSTLKHNRRRAKHAAESATRQRDALMIDAIEYARMLTGLTAKEDKTYITTTAGLKLIRDGPPIDQIHLPTPAQESADGGRKFYHPIYAAGYNGQDVSAVRAGNADRPTNKMMISFYPEAAPPPYMKFFHWQHEQWEAARQKYRYFVLQDWHLCGGIACRDVFE